MNKKQIGVYINRLFGTNPMDLVHFPVPGCLRTHSFKGKTSYWTKSLCGLQDSEETPYEWAKEHHTETTCPECQKHLDEMIKQHMEETARRKNWEANNYS